MIVAESMRYRWHFRLLRIQRRRLAPKAGAMDVKQLLKVPMSCCKVLFAFAGSFTFHKTLYVVDSCRGIYFPAFVFRHYIIDQHHAETGLPLPRSWRHASPAATAGEIVLCTVPLQLSGHLLERQSLTMTNVFPYRMTNRELSHVPKAGSTESSSPV